MTHDISRPGEAKAKRVSLGRQRRRDAENIKKHEIYRKQFEAISTSQSLALSLIGHPDQEKTKKSFATFATLRFKTNEEHEGI